MAWCAEQQLHNIHATRPNNKCVQNFFYAPMTDDTLLSVLQKVSNQQSIKGSDAIKVIAHHNMR